MIQSQEIIKKAQQQLLQTADRLNTIEIIPFQDKTLYSNDFRSLKSFKEKIIFPKSKQPLIYTIELLDKKQRQELLETFKNFSVFNKTLTKNETRINHSKDNTINNISNFLYVGSSTSDFISRMKDHLGVKKGKRTYALHLSKWDKNMEYTIRIVVYQVIDKNENPVSNNVVELIEQQIWDKLKPLFGKRSGLL